MYTRKDYLDGKCSHHEYYGQFVTDEIERLVKESIGVNAILASTDEHMNDISLIKWDSLGRYISSDELRACLRAAGDFVTPSGLVCIAKTAARIIKARIEQDARHAH